MSNEEIKEILAKQLQLLSENSDNGTIGEMVLVSNAMLEIAATLLAF